MGKRKETVLEKKMRFSNKQLAILSIIAVSVVVVGSVLSFVVLRTPNKFSLNAAIIDQLGEDFSNPQFVSNLTSILEAAEFNVTHHANKELTVDFFKKLAEYNYGMIVLRVHSALREGGSTVDLFTSEKFRSSFHKEEQSKGLLVKGILNYSQGLKEYFAFTSEFIESLEGTFPKSIVIAMGCWSLKPECEQMAEAFIEKGATVYIGWTKMVDISHTDSETVNLLRMLLENNKTVAEAVADTSPDLQYFSEMSFYPESSGNLTISNLISEVKGSTNHLGETTLFEPILTVCICRVTPKIRRVSNLAYVKLTC